MLSSEVCAVLGLFDETDALHLRIVTIGREWGR